jgi:putative transcriptional regulator
MNGEIFDELIESIHEGGAILRGEKPASRTFKFDDEEIQEIRAKLNLSQSEFAAMLGISRGTLQNWEQGRRYPDGPARVLLRVAEKHPDAVWDVVQSKNLPMVKKKDKAAKK